MLPLTLDSVFAQAHTANAFSREPVAPALLERIYLESRWAPTAMNTSPLRVMYVQSDEAKARLKDCLAPGNVDKTMAAPVTAIAAWDPQFHTHLGTLVPHMPGASARFSGDEAAAQKTGVQSATLQIGYFILAARMLGLGVGPMAGFDCAKVDAAFLEQSGWRSLLLLNLGYTDPAGVRPRAPRLDAAQALRFV
jgi:3-hydroxypropanoate dehydrogenase